MSASLLRTLSISGSITLTYQRKDTTRSLAKSQSHPNNRNLMARIIYGAIGTEIRGKVGGTVFQGNKHGYTIKNKGLNTNNTSSRQRSMKSNIIAVTQAWRSLSSTQRTNFIAFAAAYPQYDKKTGTSKLGGYEVFLLWNLNRLSRGKALSINITSVPILQSVINPQLFRYGALLYFRPECGSEYGFCEYSIFMSRPLSAGKVNPGSHMRFVDTYLEDVFNSRYYSYLREFTWRYTCCRRSRCRLVSCNRIF